MYVSITFIYGLLCTNCVTVTKQKYTHYSVWHVKNIYFFFSIFFTINNKHFKVCMVIWYIQRVKLCQCSFMFNYLYAAYGLKKFQFQVLALYFLWGLHLWFLSCFRMMAVHSFRLIEKYYEQWKYLEIQSLTFSTIFGLSSICVMLILNSSTLANNMNLCHICTLTVTPYKHLTDCV